VSSTGIVERSINEDSTMLFAKKKPNEKLTAREFLEDWEEKGDLSQPQAKKEQKELLKQQQNGTKIQKD
jgi:hypothetical protein